MKIIRNLQFHNGTREELLPGFDPGFPYIATRAEIDRYAGRFAPWHWHRSVELFYMESGTLEYFVPGKHLVFPAGSGGFVNSNVLHMTRAQAGAEDTVQILHIFEPSLIAGEQGSRIWKKYVEPVVMSGAFDIFSLEQGNPGHGKILSMIRNAFTIPQGDGFELRMREALSQIWLELREQMRSLPPDTEGRQKTNEKIRQMLTYIYEHYADKISIAELASSGYLSQRECFRIFQEKLHTTPAEYIKNYRVQMACRMLAQTTETVTAVGYVCGLGSASHFGKVFRETVGCTPLQYRKKWQDRDINRQ